jgi:hypothetical protein
MIAFRVTGPAGRADEVDAAMQALLDGTKIGPTSPARPAAPLAIDGCRAEPGAKAANLLPDLTGAELATLGLLASFDGGGIEGKDETSGAVRFLPSRIPADLCLSTRLTIGNSEVAVLHGKDGPALSVDGRTRLIAVLNDAGGYLEVVHAPNFKRFVLLRHDIATTTLLGTFDAVPTDSQMQAIITGANQAAARPRVPVEFFPEKGPVIHVPSDAPAPVGNDASGPQAASAEVATSSR